MSSASSLLTTEAEVVAYFRKLYAQEEELKSNICCAKMEIAGMLCEAIPDLEAIAQKEKDRANWKLALVQLSAECEAVFQRIIKEFPDAHL